MKASLPYKYITSVKNGKQYVVFDYKDNRLSCARQGKRKRKWVSTGLPEKCTKKALNEAGIGEDNSVRKTLWLKESFKKTKFFREAKVVYNEKVDKQYYKVKSLADLSVKKKNYVYRLDELKSSAILAFNEAYRSICRIVQCSFVSLRFCIGMPTPICGGKAIR
jgi:hypothetical protein